MDNGLLLSGDLDDMVRLSFFIEIGKAITQAASIEETLNEVMQQIGNIFIPLNWSLLLREPKTGELTFTIVVGKNAAKLQGLQLPRGEGLAGWIAETGNAVIVEDVTLDKRFSGRVDRFTGFKTQSIIGVPLKANNRVFGVIELINKINGGSFTPYELKILTTIADFTAIAIEKAYYFRALKKMATTDSLTGLCNRASFERQLARDVEMVKRYQMPLSLLLVDIDDFKQINDTHGHPTGDRVLQNMATILTGCVRKVDCVGRYGGDEFIVLMPETSRAQAEAVRNRIQERLDYQNGLGREVPYQASIGLYAMEAGNTDGLMEFLDQDLYREKHRKYERNIEVMEEHLGEMLNEEKADSREWKRRRKMAKP